MAIGRVLAASGLRGELKVDALAPPAPFAPGRQVLAGGQTHSFVRSRRRGRFLYVQLSGVSDRAAAEALRGVYLQVPEAALESLPEGQYYRFQLIGLAVRAADGRDLGRIEDLLSTPDSDVFVVRGPLGEVLVPATDDIVQKVDLEGGVVTVEVVPGLLP